MNKMSNDDKKGINPAAAGIVGAAIGAAVAGAAIALSDKENRKKVGKKLTQIRNEGEKKLTELKKVANQVSDQAKTSFDKVKTKALPASTKAAKPKKTNVKPVEESS